AQQLRKPAMLPAVFDFTLHAWKFRSPNPKGPQKRHRGDDAIRTDHTQRFELQIGLIGTGGSSAGGFRAGELDAGKKKHRTDQRRGNIPEGVKRLRKVQPAFRAFWIAELRDKRVRGSLQKRKSAGHDK